MTECAMGTKKAPIRYLGRVAWRWEPGQPPNRQQVAVVIRGQPSLNLAQVILLSSEMTLGKCAQRGVTRNSQNTLIYADRTDFAGVVGHQIG